MYNFLSLVIINGTISIKIAVEAVKMVILADTTFCYQFWYLYMTMGLYLFIPLLNVFVKNSNKKDCDTLLGVLFLFSILLRTLSNWSFGDYNEHLWKSAFLPFSGFAVYLLIGYWLHTYKLKKPTLWFIIFTILVQLVIACVLILQGDARYERLSGYQSLLTCGITVVLIICAQRLAPFLEIRKTAKVIISTIASDSFGIYIVHVIIIQMLRKIVGLDTSFAPEYISVPILTILVLLLSTVATQMMKRINKIFHNIIPL